jgi:hypothetical protein
MGKYERIETSRLTSSIQERLGLLPSDGAEGSTESINSKKKSPIDLEKKLPQARKENSTTSFALPAPMTDREIFTTVGKGLTGGEINRREP